MLRIGKDENEKMRAHGEETYPLECCGMLLGVMDGDVRRVERVVRAENARADAAHNRYAIAAEELVRVSREAREAGMEMVGFYHSHPDCEAMWSATDLAEAHWMGYAYVITEVVKGRAAETRAWVLAGEDEATKRFVEERIESA